MSEWNSEFKDDEFVIQTLETTCPHCRHKIRFPILTEHTNWKDVAERYKELLKAAREEIVRLKTSQAN